MCRQLHRWLCLPAGVTAGSARVVITWTWVLPVLRDTGGLVPWEVSLSNCCLPVVLFAPTGVDVSKLPSFLKKAPVCDDRYNFKVEYTGKSGPNMGRDIGDCSASVVCIKCMYYY